MVKLYFSLYVLMCWNFSGIVKRSGPPALKSLSLEEQIKYNKTCTYLRLKVRCSSLALSRSLTENVALPRKQLWKRDSKQKVNITFSSFNDTENWKFPAVFKRKKKHWLIRSLEGTTRPICWHLTPHSRYREKERETTAQSMRKANKVCIGHKSSEVFNSL